MKPPLHEDTTPHGAKFNRYPQALVPEKKYFFSELALSRAVIAGVDTEYAVQQTPNLRAMNPSKDFYPEKIGDITFVDICRIHFDESIPEDTFDDVDRIHLDEPTPENISPEPGANIEYCPYTGVTIEELVHEIVYQDNQQYSHMWEGEVPELDDEAIEELAKIIRADLVKYISEGK